MGIEVAGGGDGSCWEIRIGVWINRSREKWSWGIEERKRERREAWKKGGEIVGEEIIQPSLFLLSPSR